MKKISAAALFLLACAAGILILTTLFGKNEPLETAETQKQDLREYREKLAELKMTADEKAEAFKHGACPFAEMEESRIAYLTFMLSCPAELQSMPVNEIWRQIQDLRVDIVKMKEMEFSAGACDLYDVQEAKVKSLRTLVDSPLKTSMGKDQAREIMRDLIKSQSELLKKALPFGAASEEELKRKEAELAELEKQIAETER